jgi:hypothetical protein
MSDRPTRRDAGSLTLSYLIIVPVFLVAMMIITQAAMWFLARSAVLAAARQGVDVARVEPVSLTAGKQEVRSFARQAAHGYLTVTGIDVSRSTQGTIVFVVTGTVPSLVKGLPITVTQVAEAPVERFTAP